MIKITKKYLDFDGNQREEDFWFNLTAAEMYDLQKSMNGGLNALLEKIIQEQDEVRLTDYVRKLVVMSYGVKSLDGRNFHKNDEIRADFQSTNAFSDIYMELTHDSDAALKFVNGIMPSKEELEKYSEMMEKSIAKMEKQGGSVVPISSDK